jgi:hypothetical protein
MASAESPEASGVEPIQFDHAEFTTPAPAVLGCQSCKQPIPDAYFEVNGLILCDRCRQAILASFQRPQGRVFRFVKASVFGFGAALAGAAITYAVYVVSKGWTLGILSILVGWMVGKAVRKGSEMRGGWQYQVLAVALTYSAMSWSSVPVLMGHFHDQIPEKPVEVGKAEKPAAKAGDDLKPDLPAAEGKRPQVRHNAETIGGSVVLFVFSLIISYFLPYFMIQSGDIIGLLILLFGLQTAWRMTRKLNLSINGPFRVGDPGQPPGEVPAHA